jgi:hypothetical protein
MRMIPVVVVMGFGSVILAMVLAVILTLVVTGERFGGHGHLAMVARTQLI